MLEEQGGDLDKPKMIFFFELERQQKAEEKAKKEAEREKKALEKQKEIEKKNSASYKVGKAVERTTNSALSSMGRKIGNQIIKSLFKF